MYVSDQILFLNTNCENDNNNNKKKKKKKKKTYLIHFLNFVNHKISIVFYFQCYYVQHKLDLFDVLYTTSIQVNKSEEKKSLNVCFRSAITDYILLHLQAQ